MELSDRVCSLEAKSNDHETRITTAESQIADIRTDCSKDMGSLSKSLDDRIILLMKNSDNTLFILKWVVLPLIIILGGLIGVKIALPV